MRLVNQIRFGPFKASYHRSLVDAAFIEQFELFLQANLVPQLDSTIREFDGTLMATFDNEKNCGPNSLVRDIFTFECSITCDDGTSELKADVVCDPKSHTFRPRTGFECFFYVWTPNRRKIHESELGEIQRVVDAILRGYSTLLACPICGGTITAINNEKLFDARCTRQRCFVYNYHKDKRGRLAHGHFFTTHPMKRAEQSDADDALDPPV